KKKALIRFPIDLKRVTESGSVTLKHFNHAIGSVKVIKPVTLDLNNEVATFNIYKFGTYFLDYGSSAQNPSVEYTTIGISDLPQNFGYDRILKLNEVINTEPPYSIVLNANLNGARLKSVICQNASVSHTPNFPLVLSNLSVGQEPCEIHYLKQIDSRNYFEIVHLIEINIEKSEMK